jgi:pimeloyl-ACP methyl ester carboxylesterase
MAADELKPPPARLLLTEWPRAAATVVRLAAARARLDAAPRGDGRPVLVLPGLFNSDLSNTVLRRYLTRLGYAAHPWTLGRNFGARTIGGDASRLLARVEQVAADAAVPVTLIGVSLGGIMARLVAHRRPGLVREVITVASPYAAHPRATNVWRAFELVTGERVDSPEVRAVSAEVAAPLPVRTTAIWSARDGLVNGHACRDGHARCIEVKSGHIGIQLNPEVLLVIAQVLADEIRGAG